MTSDAAVREQRIQALLQERCDGNKNRECLPIEIPQYDAFYRGHNQRCMNFVRTHPGLRYNCRLGPRNSVNQITSFFGGGYKQPSQAVPSVPAAPAVPEVPKPQPQPQPQQQESFSLGQVFNIPNLLGRPSVSPPVQQQPAFRPSNQEEPIQPVIKQLPAPDLSKVRN